MAAIVKMLKVYTKAGLKFIPKVISEGDLKRKIEGEKISAEMDAERARLAKEKADFEENLRNLTTEDLQKGPLSRWVYLPSLKS